MQFVGLGLLIDVWCYFVNNFPINVTMIIIV